MGFLVITENNKNIINKKYLPFLYIFLIDLLQFFILVTVRV